MIQTIKYSKNLKTYSRKLGSIALLLIIGFAIAQGGIYAIDHYSFPGCTIVGYEAGNTLVIELDSGLLLFFYLSA